MPGEPILNQIMRRWFIHASRAALETTGMEVVSTSQHQYPWPQVADLQEGIRMQRMCDQKQGACRQIRNAHAGELRQNRKTRFTQPPI